MIFFSTPLLKQKSFLTWLMTTSKSHCGYLARKITKQSICLYLISLLKSRSVISNKTNYFHYQVTQIMILLYSSKNSHSERAQSISVSAEKYCTEARYQPASLAETFWRYSQDKKPREEGRGGTRCSVSLSLECSFKTFFKAFSSQRLSPTGMPEPWYLVSRSKRGEEPEEMLTSSVHWWF